MTITIISFLLGLLLIVVPLYLLHALQVPLFGKVLTAFGRAAAMLLALGACLWLVFHFNHWAVSLLAVLLMVGVGMLLVVRKARLGHRMLVPIGAGLFVALLVVGAWLLLLALGVRRPLEAQYLLPIAGLLVGSMTETLARALSVYYRSLIHHDQLYYYVIGNGASCEEALSWYVRRSLEAVVLPHLKSMSTIVVVSSPLVVWALLLGGSSVAEAIAVQFLVLVAGFTASVVALVVALFVARRYSFDGYGRLKQPQSPTPTLPKGGGGPE